MKIKAYFLGEDVDLHVWISEEGNLEEKGTIHYRGGEGRKMEMLGEFGRREPCCIS
jgi:hypothetical protein